MWSKLFIVVLYVHYLSAGEIHSGLGVPTVTCPAGYKPICVAEDPDPTDSSTTPGSTTEDKEFRTFCTNNGDGDFTNESDPTCKTYIYCIGGRGMSYKCAKANSKETWFNGAYCTINKPDYCS